MPKDITASGKLRRAFLCSLFSSWGLMLLITILHLPTVLLIISPIFVMFIYLRYFFQLKDTKVFQDQFADSFYSLGFLLTLTALVFSFMPLLMGKSSITMEGTIGNFGVALLTTLLGLTVRIYLTSFSIDLEHLESQAAYDLSQNVHFFEEKLKTSIAIMEKFNSELQTTTEKTVTDFESTFANVGNGVTKTIVDTMEEALNPLTETFANLSQKVDKTTREFEQDLKNSFNDCVQRVEAIELEPDTLSKIFQPIVDDFTTTASSMNESTNSISKSLKANAEDFASSMENFSSTTNNLSAKLSESLKSMAEGFKDIKVDPQMLTSLLESVFEEFKSAISEVADQTRKHGSVLEKSSASIKEAMPGYEKFAQNMKSIIDLNESLSTPKEAFTNLSSEISGTAEKLQNLEGQIEKFVGAVGESLESYKSISEAIAKEKEDIHEIRSELGNGLKDSTKTLEELRMVFTETAKFIINKLHPEGAK